LLHLASSSSSKARKQALHHNCSNSSSSSSSSLLRLMLLRPGHLDLQQQEQQQGLVLLLQVLGPQVYEELPAAEQQTPAGRLPLLLLLLGLQDWVLGHCHPEQQPTAAGGCRMHLAAAGLLLLLPIVCPQVCPPSL
jgi:hypothetical protein